MADLPGVGERVGGWARRLKACTIVAGGKRSAAPGWCPTEWPDPERVVYSLRRVRPDVYATPAGSNGTGVGVTVGGVRLRRTCPRLL